MTALILAYLDPGSSSMIVQMFLGGVAAAGVALKLYWRRLLRLLRIRKDDPVDEPAAPSIATASANGSDAGPGAQVERGPVETTKS